MEMPLVLGGSKAYVLGKQRQEKRNVKLAIAPKLRLHPDTGVIATYNVIDKKFYVRDKRNPREGRGRGGGGAGHFEKCARSWREPDTISNT